MRVVVEAPAPTDLISGHRKGTYLKWGWLEIPSVRAVHDPGDAGRWYWRPFAEIRDVDTFWGYIRDDLEREYKPVEARHSRFGLDDYQGAEGSVQLDGGQLVLWGERPKKRMAMFLWGFRPQRVDQFSTGTGILYRGNTVFNVQEARFLERSEGIISSLFWSIGTLDGYGSG
jgi:hypothetical protein